MLLMVDYTIFIGNNVLFSFYEDAFPANLWTSVTRYVEKDRMEVEERVPSQHCLHTVVWVGARFKEGGETGDGAPVRAEFHAM